ncbi:MAG: RNA 2',3'-cyclic phosphodiesterase [Verrucomicrobia subdivision 3 bacterium]|nr:RNA 2',3'-cyclic phosphodiesterase [Limisphaerales bacterium]MCS1414467.1 RNA 2',3'-cyclic phosphodiesterase [Limisphaerales bacterium]
MGSGSAKSRVFVAVLAEEEWRRRLGVVKKELSSCISSDSVRWVSQEKIHLTLVFLGYVESDDFPLLNACLSEICEGTNRLRVRLLGLGVFPNWSRPRVLWAGIDGDLDALADLQSQLFRVCTGFGEDRTSGTFRPHVTIARFIRRLPPAWCDRIRRLEPSFEGSEVAVRAIVLMKSELFDGGSRYLELGRFALQ